MYNGSGVFQLYTPGNPTVTGTTISSTWANNTLSDIATGLSTAITKDGQTTPTANIPLGGFKLTNVGLGTASTDAATLANLQAGTGTYVATIGGTADAITLTPSPAIAAYAAGQQFSFIASGANTGAVTVDVSGLGAKAVTKSGATALIAGDIPASAMALIEYDGTQFQLINAIPSVSSLTMATSRLLGRITAGTGSVEQLTAAQALDMLLTTRGDLVRRGAATSERFAIGTAGRVLQSDGTDPVWGGIASRSAAVATTSGVSILFTGIPAGVSVVRIKLNGVSTNGTGIIGFQLGDSGGIENTGYASCGTQITTATNPTGVNQTAFFPINGTNTAAATYYGVAEFRRLGPTSNTWIFTATGCRSDGPANTVGAGAKTLSDELTQILLTNNAGDTFDAGQAAIEWEF